MRVFLMYVCAVAHSEQVFVAQLQNQWSQSTNRDDYDQLARTIKLILCCSHMAQCPITCLQVQHLLYCFFTRLGGLGSGFSTPRETGIKKLLA